MTEMQLACLIIFSCLLLSGAQPDDQNTRDTKTDKICDATGCTEEGTEPSIVTRNSHHECTTGHHPFQQCTITNAMLDKQEKTFKAYKSAEVNSLDISKTWSVVSVEDPFTCDKTFNYGFVFLFYYYKGSSNYFHLHYDTLIPLYYLLRDHMTNGYLSDEVLLMPSVETSRLKVTSSLIYTAVSHCRSCVILYTVAVCVTMVTSLQAIDWETTAFSYTQDEQPIWMQMLSVSNFAVHTVHVIILPDTTGFFITNKIFTW